MIGAIGSIIVDAFNICRNLDGNSPIWNILMLIGHAAYEGQIIRRIMKARSLGVTGPAARFKSMASGFAHHERNGMPGHFKPSKKSSYIIGCPG